MEIAEKIIENRQFVLLLKYISSIFRLLEPKYIKESLLCVSNILIF